MPDRAAVFAKGMTWLGQLPGYSPQHLVDNFPWGAGSSSTNSDRITVVDVGGGNGHIAHALAAHSSSVRCIVQDRAEIVSQASSPQGELQDRITFQAHDFFQDQPVHGADVYLVRHVLHDWSDKYARRILKALIPALRPGAKVVVNDRVMPGFGEAHYLAEREARYVYFQVSSTLHTT